MNHKENYAKVLNALSNVETKGNNTIIVADCMRFLAQCVQECEQEEENQRVAKIMAMEKAEAKLKAETEGAQKEETEETE